ncbi:response regulator [Brevundimonas sp. SL130]|uniref:response regulator n=1 Tax=Brevundimonas sp. SL130 TaxID=2995143 RepID=UPI00226C9F34|nr:response regulator [Brevundimonas sp. SL130]WAC59908.1 response regulator [Brevundimonas sp. SL130]
MRRGRWRFFRHDAGREAGPPPWLYVLLFIAALALGQWSVAALNVTVVWPANAVLLAAVLQLPRDKARGVLIGGVLLNLANNIVRGDPTVFAVLNVALNLLQVVVATLLARRLCGAALDMRRPKRLFRFAIGAVIPAVALTTVLAGVVVIATRRLPLELINFRLHHLFDMELLAMMIVTPALLLVARTHRFRNDAQASPLEVVALIGLVGVTALGVFGQSVAPIMFLIFPPLILLAFRLSPPWTAAALLIVTLVAAGATLNGIGPIGLTRLTQDPALASIPAIMRQMNVLHVFLLALVATVLPITTLSSERRRLFARLHDRTETALAALQRAEKADAAKSRFLAMMSHEMRTPLTGITGYADLLSRHPELDLEGRRQVEAVRQCGEAMLRLIEDLLEVSSGGGELASKPVDIPALVEEAMGPAREWATVRGLNFVIDYVPGAEGAALTDGRRLRQILHHLGSNAVKFTGRGGVRIQVERRDDRLRFEIHDTGCGMTKDVLAGIFSLFEQADATTRRAHEGAGVGLALAKTHIDRMGGSVWVESTPAMGTTFTVEIPAPAVEVPATAEALAVQDRRMRVLIVDDHPSNRDLMRIMLEAADCETAEASDGREAVEAVQAGAFDLVLMDVRMPVMDGVAATRAIRALDGPAAEIAILAVTAEAMPEDVARCLSAGMDAHVAKPITQARLYAAMDQAMDAAENRIDNVQAA